MSNRRAFIIWLSVSFRSSRSFRIALPVPLILLLGVSDFLEDAAFLIPARKGGPRGGEFSSSSAKSILIACAAFLRETALHTEPFELADIDVADGDSRLAVKCLIK